MFHRNLISPIRLNFLVQSNPFSKKQLSKMANKHRKRYSKVNEKISDVHEFKDLTLRESEHEQGGGKERDTGIIT